MPPTATQVHWLDLSLGETQTEVYARYGDAGLSSKWTDGVTTSIMYTIGGARGQLYVTFRNARVIAIQLTGSTIDGSTNSIADPYGITLMMTADDVTSRRGKGDSSIDEHGGHLLVYYDPSGTKWTYRFTPRGMLGIKVEAPSSAIDAMPPAPVATTHGGTSFDDALVNGAEDERSGARNEYFAILSLRCLNNGGLWRESDQKLVEHSGHKYDVLNLTCYRSPETRDLYFQIDSFFGKF